MATLLTVDVICSHVMMLSGDAWKNGGIDTTGKIPLLWFLPFSRGLKSPQASCQHFLRTDHPTYQYSWWVRWPTLEVYDFIFVHFSLFMLARAVNGGPVIPWSQHRSHYFHDLETSPPGKQVGILIMHINSGSKWQSILTALASTRSPHWGTIIY